MNVLVSNTDGSAFRLSESENVDGFSKIGDFDNKLVNADIVPDAAVRIILGHNPGLAVNDDEGTMIGIAFTIV
ncbi:hypothetical protein EXU18_11500 [Klebsiella pneumoniae]|uniref:hypothetical protein n=1 Tax=Klebsiella pneumoniae TaxID=573 RepID=UPI0010372149|nr:hypothetical protein [Klebsiella pneumoniae]TBO67164.1 hypothetical protein EXT87_19850 [Klebsiella pneumoniae]TBO84399.1 hypothetical protein EXT98_06160 [Klebsiella pneumoniae]TBP53019.1 hypothetical protein EXU18_11500 [Klebsiella pneumoniae]